MANGTTRTLAQIRTDDSRRQTPDAHRASVAALEPRINHVFEIRAKPIDGTPAESSP
jgi:hypothetical protein